MGINFLMGHTNGASLMLTREAQRLYDSGRVSVIIYDIS